MTIKPRFASTSTNAVTTGRVTVFNFGTGAINRTTSDSQF